MVRDFFQTATILMPGVVRLGPVRLQVYGLFAAVGLVAAVVLSLRTARTVGLAADQIWDAGLFAVMAAFVCSRLLLIAGNFHAFLQMPVALLALPSFTTLGMVLTGLVVVAYLRWKKLSLLRVLDAWAPCVAVLAAMLSLGKFLEGNDAGMPTSLPWAIKTPLSGGLRVHPVAMYSAIAAGLMVVVLVTLLRRKLRAGMVAGAGLIAAGAAGFLIDMVTQPVEMRAGAWLDPAQWAAVGAMVVGSGLLLWRPTAPLTHEETALILENFVSGAGGPHDHEALEYGSLTDPLLLEIRARFVGLPSEYPPNPGEQSYCNERGIEVLRAYARQLRASGSNMKEVS